MKRLPLRDLITQKPQPELTPSLVPAFQHNSRQMVETYIFTDTIRAYFDEILDAVARGHGQAFWVQAEYGAGKTHFLVTLAALLADTRDGLWSSVQDDQIRLAQRRLGPTRLFPVVLSLRGQGGGDTYLGRSLLDVLLEEGFHNALEATGLAAQVQVTAAEDILEWLEHKASPAIRAEAETFVQQQTGQRLPNYRDNEGIEATAGLLREYFASAGIRPEIAAGMKARLGHIYRQLTDPAGPGYNGLLVVIDEYEGWEKSHNTPQELSHDTELLETLGFLLPRDLGYQVYTIVASQSAVPAKLQGSQAGDRFINIPILAQNNERDYDIIISRRARGLADSRTPEINDHYTYYSQHFAFAQHLSEAEFRDIFPFQPRCFEVVRRITARDLPTARSGLLVFWQVVNQADLLKKTSLIRLTDMTCSSHLVEDCLSKSVYKDSYNAYKAALEALDMLDLEEPEDLELARDTLTTLYLWYLAFMEQPRRMSLKELAEATLTTDDILRAEDTVAYVLNSMQVLRQVEFDNQSAAFIPAGGEGPSILTTFNEHKRRALRDRYKLRSAWTSSLFFTPRDTGGASGLFHDFTPDTPHTRRVESRRMEYSGEVIVTSSARLDHGLALPKQDTHFRLVILTASAVQSLKPADLQDPRIAVVLPGEMTDEVREAAAAYVAWHSMSEEFGGQAGRQAEEIRSWLDGRKQSIYNELTATHLKLYQAGQILSRDNLGISARDAFGQGGGNDRRIAYIVERLLTAAYPNLPLETDGLRRTLTPSDAGKIFEGYFNKNARTAERTATRNYGVGLGLSHPDKPERFAPHPQGVAVFKLIETMLAERQGSDLPIWQLYDKLSAPPYGLPYVIIQLYLLAFVRHASPRVDLLLKARHNLRTRQGQPWPRDRLTASSVVDLAWKAGLDKDFDALVPSTGPQWNDVLPYAREILADLKATTDQAEVETQFQRLCQELQKLQGEATRQQRNLEALAGALNATLPPAATTALEQLAGSTLDPADGYADFYEQVERTFAGPEALRDTMQTFTRLRELTAVAAEISNARRYLDEVSLRPTDRDLAADCLTISTQLTLESLVDNPDTWQRLRNEFDRFKGRYRNEYQKHHRDYYAVVTRLRASLVDVPHRLEALSLLNGIEGLGPAVGEDLNGRFQDLDERLPACVVTEVTAVEVDHQPTCRVCGLRLTDSPPEDEVTTFSTALDDALKRKTRQLAAEAVSRVLARSGRDDLTTFVEAVQASDLAALVDVMSPDLADFINRLLAEESILNTEADILAQLAHQYPSLEEKDIEAVVDQFRQLLEQAFAAARRANPEKKTIRLTLR
ncbi:MAG: hypothetical protein ACE5H9_14975 [Anaerolineae bacterium]